MRTDHAQDGDSDLTSPDLDALERLQYALLTPLTTVRGRAQLLARRVERLDGLDADQRAWLIHCATTIDAAVTRLVAQITSMEVAVPVPTGEPVSGPHDGADVTPIRSHPTRHE